MKKVKLILSSYNYEVIIGTGLLASAGTVLADLGFKGKTAVITDNVVGELYSKTLLKSLDESGLDAILLTVPSGEEYKTLDSAGTLYRHLSESGAERSTPVIALGGGVTGDLAGFVAATFKRGVPYIQIPTTLLAQIDSSVGGKVAVDHGQLKNEIGAFYQPRLVISDVSVLDTLPEREIIGGLAEIIKHAAIADSDLFGYLEDNIERLKAIDKGVMEETVYRSVSIKAAVVMKDERDTGLRNILNYGHTVGHAFETVSNFGLRHGEAVALGMMAAGRIAYKMGFLDKGDMERVETLIRKAGLPCAIPEYDTETILDVMGHDKKVVDGKLRFVLLNKIGDVFVTDRVEMSLVREAIDELRGT